MPEHEPLSNQQLRQKQEEHQAALKEQVLDCQNHPGHDARFTKYVGSYMRAYPFFQCEVCIAEDKADPDGDQHGFVPPNPSERK